MSNQGKYLTMELKQKFEAILKAHKNVAAYWKGDALMFMFEAYLLDREEWISVKDELPPYGVKIRAIITFGNGKMEEIRTVYIERTKCFDHLLCDIITHWQYIRLPTPPNQ